jgi:hypothetical protein
VVFFPVTPLAESIRSPNQYEHKCGSQTHHCHPDTNIQGGKLESPFTLGSHLRLLQGGILPLFTTNTLKELPCRLDLLEIRSVATFLLPNNVFLQGFNRQHLIVPVHIINVLTTYRLMTILSSIAG